MGSTAVETRLDLAFGVPLLDTTRAYALEKLRGGLLSGMSYSNARTIAEMHERAQFIIVKNPGGPEQRRPLQT